MLYTTFTHFCVLCVSLYIYINTLGDWESGTGLINVLRIRRPRILHSCPGWDVARVHRWTDLSRHCLPSLPLFLSPIFFPFLSPGQGSHLPASASFLTIIASIHQCCNQPWRLLRWRRIGGWHLTVCHMIHPFVYLSKPLIPAYLSQVADSGYFHINSFHNVDNEMGSECL